MRFGVLGEAKIARKFLVPAIIEAGHKVTHLGRSNSRKDVVPDIYGDIVVTDYEGLLVEDSIDAIYIPLPNHLHVKYSIKALKAGKHVLCEKPVAMSLEELEELESVAVDTGKYFQEAYMIGHHPQWDWLKNIDIGNIKSAQAIFSYPPQPEGNYRNSAEFGGGPLYDIGCYAILAGCIVFGGTPEVVSAISEVKGKDSVERQVDATLRWPNGEVLSFSVSSDTVLCQSFIVLGDDGWAKLEVPFNPPETTFAHFSGGGLINAEKVVFPRCNQYKLMVDDFVDRAISGKSSNFELSKSITKTIQKIQKRSGLK